MTTRDRPLLPDDLRGLLPWKIIAKALNRDIRHTYRIVACAVTVIVVLMTLSPEVWQTVLAYCAKQRDAWRESEVRSVLQNRYGVKAEHLERTD